MKYSNATLWYTVFLLTLASTLSFIDRQILNVMIGPIKRDLGGLSDTEISLIIGLAFSLVYSLTTLPLARLADRYSLKLHYQRLTRWPRPPLTPVNRAKLRFSDHSSWDAIQPGVQSLGHI